LPVVLDFSTAFAETSRLKAPLESVKVLVPPAETLTESMGIRLTESVTTPLNVRAWTKVGRNITHKKPKIVLTLLFSDIMDSSGWDMRMVLESAQVYQILI
jgi:hypothetical protein